MGDIYLATDDVLGREVAVKILSERHAADETIRQRFRREGLAAAQRSGEQGAVKVFFWSRGRGFASCGGR
jgi:serine/threonine protein kinase